MRAVADLLDGHDNGMVHLCAGARAMTVGDIVALAWEIWERDPAWRRPRDSATGFCRPRDLSPVRGHRGETADRRLQRIMRGLGSYAPQLAYPIALRHSSRGPLVGHCPPPAAEIWRTVLERTAADGRSAREVAAVSATLHQDPFAPALVAWLNQKFAPAGAAIAADTPLFQGGLINSIRILEIIAWVERAIGRQIADREIRMDNFASARRIAEVFDNGGTHVDR